MLHKANIIVLLILAACSSAPEAQPLSDSHHRKNIDASPEISDLKRPRILLIGLDGVPFETFKKLQNGGHFRDFKPVAPMVSSFPSISDPNWSRLLGYPVEESYTKEHFQQDFKGPNGATGRITGGLMDQVQKPPEYESYFDVKPEGFVAHLASIGWSATTGAYWLNSMEKRFFEADATRDFAVFILNTDIIAHTKGEEDVMKFLALLETRLKRMRKKHLMEKKRELEVILVSDHGNAYLSPHPIFPTEDLKKKGWNVTESIASDRDVAFVFPEILAFAALYCRDSAKASLAIDVAATDGVHTAFYESAPNTVTFQAKSGASRVIADPAQKTLKYEVLRGDDPLWQIQLFKKKPVLTWREYFEATVDAPYPYALVRAWEAFHVNSKEPAQVLVTPALGYVFANKTLHLLTKFWGLKSVHGSMNRSDTLGIAVSTHRDFSPLRPEDFGAKARLSR